MDERKTQLDAIALGSLVFCCLLWGLNQVAAKSAIAIGLSKARRAGVALRPP